MDLGSPETLEELLASPEYIDEHADLARLYQAFFNRVPDVGGLAYWIDVYEDGATLTEVSFYFSRSDEFRNTYGEDPANPEFLTAVYSNVLGRDYDQGGFDYWLGLMNDGLPRHETVFWIVGGEEFKTNYPFLGTFPDVESALLGPADVPADYTDTGTLRYDLTEQELTEARTCARLRVLHTNTYQTYLGREDGSEFLLQEIYAFSSVADAERVIDNHLRLPSECNETLRFDNGSELTITHRLAPPGPLNARFVDHAALQVTWQWTNGPTYNFHLIVGRIDNVVVITDLTRRDGQPSYDTAVQYAITTGNRIEALLD